MAQVIPNQGVVPQFPKGIEASWVLNLSVHSKGIFSGESCSCLWLRANLQLLCPSGHQTRIWAAARCGRMRSRSSTRWQSRRKGCGPRSLPLASGGCGSALRLARQRAKARARQRRRRLGPGRAAKGRPRFCCAAVGCTAAAICCAIRRRWRAKNCGGSRPFATSCGTGSVPRPWPASWPRPHCSRPRRRLLTPPARLAAVRCSAADRDRRLLSRVQGFRPDWAPLVLLASSAPSLSDSLLVLACAAGVSGRWSTDSNFVVTCSDLRLDLPAIAATSAKRGRFDLARCVPTHSLVCCARAGFQAQRLLCLASCVTGRHHSPAASAGHPRRRPQLHSQQSLGVLACVDPASPGFAGFIAFLHFAAGCMLTVLTSVVCVCAGPGWLPASRAGSLR